MDIHEYQAKELLSKFGVPIPRGGLAYSPEQATYRANEIGGSKWAVKAQIHSGARGKAGGIKLCRNDSELWDAADQLLGKRLSTVQTGPNGKIVSRLYIEEATEIDREFYLSYVMDRAAERIVVVASAAGGMDIEEVAASTPEKILTVAINPATGLQPYQCRMLAFGLGLSGKQVKQFGAIVSALAKMFVEKDASLVEINPLIVTGEDDLVALDGKVNLEGNALYRQPDLVEWRDPSQEDAKESEASAHGLNYVALDGNIACMVNGAGLAMATMDLIKLHGGQPANFLDVGGGATAERVTEAFKLILSNDNVKGILVNIFGGIVRCDLIAEGIIQAVKDVGVSVPVIVRLEGTNVDKGRELLAGSGLDIITADDLTDAANKVIAAAA